jgi:hypothetical protein
VADAVMDHHELLVAGEIEGVLGADPRKLGFACCHARTSVF